MAEIVLINPRFEVSYWGLEHALPLLGKRGSVPPACLPLLAALTPDEHQVTLLDENIQPIDYDRVARRSHRRGFNAMRAASPWIATRRHHAASNRMPGPREVSRAMNVHTWYGLPSGRS